MKWLGRISLLLIIIINMIMVGCAIATGIYGYMQHDAASGLICSALWIIWIVICNAKGLSELDLRPRRYMSLVAVNGLPDNTEFHPLDYYRLVKRRGWRNVILEIDEAIELPNAEIIPVYPEAGTTSFAHDGGCMVTWVRFEYRGQFFCGWLRK